MNDIAEQNVKAHENNEAHRYDKVSKSNAVPRSKQPLVSEIYTSAENVMKEAVKRGHNVGTSMSLESGWNFLNREHRRKAYHKVMEEKPFCLVLAFPCGGFSPLQRLNGKFPERRALRREVARELMSFALQLAELQIREGRHCVLENPKPSEAWNEVAMQKFIEEHQVHLADFDQCRFGLRSLTGELHRKPTRMVSSGSKIADQVNGFVCTRDHSHSPVIGGAKVTARAGIYPRALACALVKGIEKQFEADFKSNEVLALQAGEDEEEELAFEGGELAPRHDDDEGSDVEDGQQPDGKPLTVPAGVRAAVLRLHQNTGHRSGKRLARALAIAGAPSEAILAAKQLQCSVCKEHQAPKVRRPASLPLPKDMGDQVHVDLLEVEDCKEQKFWVAHATDYATRFQLAEIIPDKSTASVVKFLSNRWVATFGPPRVMVVDQGREFISWEMEEYASSQSILLHHIAVQAPWQNGVAERSGGILKTLLAAIVTSKTVIGKDDMELALSEAVSAYNGDINESGASPYQAAIGRQPRMIGGIQTRLAEHGLLESKPSLARQLAMREVAKVAMTRLHFSRGLRKAELGRSRNPTVQEMPEPGTICYFFRPMRYNSKTGPSKKKLTLKRWHGPALLVAVEGKTSAYLSYKGQLTKCALEHVRQASTMEQIAAESWREAIDEAVEAATLDLTRQGLPEPIDGQSVGGGGGGLSAPATPGFLPSIPPTIPVPSTPPPETAAPGQDLPPVRAQDLAMALGSAAEASLPGSGLSSRRVSDTGTAPSGLQRGLSDGLRSDGFRRRADTGFETGKVPKMPDPAGIKRPSEVTAEQLRSTASAAASADSVVPAEVPVPEDPAFEAMEVSKHQHALDLSQSSQHPLVQIFEAARQDRRQPLEAHVPDHGSWDGRWPLPSKSEWLCRQQLGLCWPKGKEDIEDHETMAVQAARKEYFWKNMPEEQKPAFREAAAQAWSVWKENDAIEELTPEESATVRERLKRNREQCKILTPRYVFTDKHDPLRTESSPLPLKARARIVVPGFKDILGFGLRKDAPTCSRIAQHFLLTLTAAFHWVLMSADIKSAFLKGDPYMAGVRERFMENVRGRDGEPRLPFPDLVKIKKGVFGLADAPRMWYLRLHRALSEAGWERCPLDYACWLLWSPDRITLEGMILAHVDDLLLGDNQRAKKKLLELGDQLGFGAIEEGEFTYCGKKFKQRADGTIQISMKEYHENLKCVPIPVHRRERPDAELLESERKQLRAILGSLQWLVAQLRFDMGFLLSTLQGESQTVGTLMKANQLVKKFKQCPDFSLTFKPMDLSDAGLMVVTDASLGNVTKQGGAEGTTFEKVFSQSAYFVLLGDKDLTAGREGNFSVIDSRSHRLPRVCRSTYGAELQGTEEAFDVGLLCRGWLALLKGLPYVEAARDTIPLCVVTDAKDVYDKNTSDTPTYGSQKSLAFTVAWIRQVLGKPNTLLK